MNNNDDETCDSIHCCCKLITTKDSSVQVCESDKDCRKELSFCEFLKSQPPPEWTKKRKYYNKLDNEKNTIIFVPK